MHPVTIGPGIPPQRFATIIAYQPPATQKAFLYALHNDLSYQTVGDLERGYDKLAEDIGRSLRHLSWAGNRMNDESLDEQVVKEVTPYAQAVGALRYDAMILFLQAYAQETGLQELYEAASCVKEAWKHTPRSWKEQYAPETLRR